jgi:hypothetical protein
MRDDVTLSTRRGSGSPAALLPRSLLLLLLLGQLLAPAQAADNLRCGSRIVSLRAIAAEVDAVCGEPAYIDRWEIEPPPYTPYLADTEVWYYNFGSNRLLQVLKFRNGRLASIDTDGYGFDQLPQGQCGPAGIVEGESSYRLLSRCGEPVARRSTGALRALQPHGDGNGRYTTVYGDAFTPVYREEWVYNFGSRFRQQTVTLENGRVVAVEDGGAGFDPR